jgi:two-component system LytT family response regulator
MNFSIFTRTQKDNMLRTIIIDDESHVRRTIRSLVTHYCPHLQIAGEADGVGSGIETIRKLRPDLVLLDIRMKDGTGFDLLKKLDPIDFKVIFITAYDQYAVQAFKYSAVDYILKPVDPEDLIQAVNRTEKMLKGEVAMHLKALEGNLSPIDAGDKKIVIKTLDNIYLVSQREILYCEADGSYTTLCLANGKSIVTSRLLKEFDEILSPHGFYRVHKSFLINLSAIERFEKAEGGFLVLKEGGKIPVASRKKEELVALFEKLV